MKNLVIILSAFSLLATGSVYSMESTQEMTKAKTFQPASLREQALGAAIRSHIQPALDQLSVDTFNDVRDELLTFCNDSDSIGKIPIEYIIKIDSKEEISYKVLVLELIRKLNN